MKTIASVSLTVEELDEISDALFFKEQKVKEGGFGESDAYCDVKKWASELRSLGQKIDAIAMEMRS